MTNNDNNSDERIPSSSSPSFLSPSLTNGMHISSTSLSFPFLFRSSLLIFLSPCAQRVISCAWVWSAMFADHRSLLFVVIVVVGYFEPVDQDRLENCRHCTKVNWLGERAGSKRDGYTAKCVNDAAGNQDNHLILSIAFFFPFVFSPLCFFFASRQSLKQCYFLSLIIHLR